MDKSSSQQLVTAQNFTVIESFKQITTSGKIPNSGFLQIIFVVGAERYHIIFDTVRGIIQPFFCGQDQNYNFFLKLRIDSDTKISVSVNSLKGYSLSDFANKLIWVRTYYA